MSRPENPGRFIEETISLCPRCLKRIPARILEINGEIYMRKTCPEHGEFNTVIWRDSKENYLKWLSYGGEKRAFSTGKTSSCIRYGCPYDCGICPDHLQDICSAAIMVTNRCNIDCPVCFTRIPGDPCYEPDLKSVKEMFKFYLEFSGEPYPIELCGGEPTIRDDLPEIVSMGKEMGFGYIQVNTNGIRISRDKKYLKKLKEAGLTTVYMGFDGITEEPYIYSSGRGLLATKIRAVENCAEVGLAVVLVPCVMPGVNDHQLGGIIQLAKKWAPTVKGVHFQPVSYFGNYPAQPGNEDRITIPEVLKALEKQTQGEIKIEDFLPGGCEHPQCSFNGFFLQNKAGKLQAFTKFQKRGNEEDAARKARAFIRANWVYSEKKYLTVGGMHFQDVWNVDLNRLKWCIIYIISPDKKFLPLCAKYLTSIGGKKIYPGIA